jgi:hypothetical protein
MPTLNVRLEQHMKPRSIFLFSLFLLAVPAIGQVRAPNQEKIDNIRHLLKITGSEKLQQNMIEQMIAALKPILTASVQGDQRAQRVFGRMTELLTEEFKKADFAGVTVEVYDKYFTNEDIKGLIQFYESPIGQKAVQVLPTLTQESMARGMELGQSAGQRAMVRLIEEFPELKASQGGPARD